MELEKARKLREKWEDKPCFHPSFQKEYYNGKATGDYVCIICGRVFTEDEKEELENGKLKLHYD